MEAEAGELRAETLELRRQLRDQAAREEEYRAELGEAERLSARVVASFFAKFRQNVARFRLYRLRFLQVNMRFAAFFKIYQILKLKFLKFDKILQILRHLQFFC